jgi:thiol:disulfide interchange protein DsbA
MIRRFLAAAAFAAIALAHPLASAQSVGAFLEINPPIGTDAKGKIEVVEFFWYECPHCYSLEPYLEAWLKKLPKDVEFRRVPAIWNQQMAISARVFYALEAIGELDRLHKPLFDAIHKDRLRITNERQLLDWLERQKVDVSKFSAAASSFAVESRLKRGLELWQASKADGVPAMMVNGRFLVLAGAGNTEQRMIATTDALVAAARKELAATAPKPAPAQKAANK